MNSEEQPGLCTTLIGDEWEKVKKEETMIKIKRNPTGNIRIRQCPLSSCPTLRLGKKNGELAEVGGAAPAAPMEKASTQCSASPRKLTALLPTTRAHTRTHTQTHTQRHANPHIHPHPPTTARADTHARARAKQRHQKHENTRT